jgi:hypothetical protein
MGDALTGRLQGIGLAMDVHRRQLKVSENWVARANAESRMLQEKIRSSVLVLAVDHPPTRYMAVRVGNVLGPSGSPNPRNRAH